MPQPEITISLDDQIRCLIRELGFRELGFRERVYPAWIKQGGKITQEQADKELARMKAALETLKGLKACGFQPEAAPPGDLLMAVPIRSAEQAEELAMALGRGLNTWADRPPWLTTLHYALQAAAAKARGAAEGAPAGAGAPPPA